MTIYDRIKEQLKLKHISVRQMELDLGFYNGTINRWKDTAPTDKITAVAKYLGVTVEFLVLGHNQSQTDLPLNWGGKKVKRHVEITDPTVAMTFEGKPIPEDDMELIKRLLRGRD